MSAPSLFGIEDVKKAGEQFVRSATAAVASHLNEFVGLGENSGRKTQVYDTAKAFVFEGVKDVSIKFGLLRRSRARQYSSR